MPPAPDNIQRALTRAKQNILRALVSESLAVNRKDGSVLIRIPGGEYEMGDGKEESCPKHKVWVSEYWVGVYCVTNGQYARFIKETGHRAPDKADYGEAVWKNGACPAEKMEHPVVCVSWDDCVAYGKWAGLELPSEAQWEKACRGPLGLVYPWGGDWEEGKKCRNDKNKGSEQTALVHSYPNGVSGYGSYQQSGNVWEWCADWYDSDYYKKSPARDPRGPETGSFRVYRGGSWWGGDASIFRGAFRYIYVPGDRVVSQGFRLVRNSP